MEPRLDVSRADPEHIFSPEMELYSSGNGVIPEHVLVWEEAAHPGPEAQAVRSAAVECPGEAGGVTRLIPQLRAKLGAVLPTANTCLHQGDMTLLCMYVRLLELTSPSPKIKP